MQKRGGAWNAQERQNHINVLEMQASEIALQSPSKRRNKKPRSFENGQHDSGSICQKIGEGHKSPILIKVAKNMCQGRSLSQQSTSKASKIRQQTWKAWRLWKQAQTIGNWTPKYSVWSTKLGVQSCQTYLRRDWMLRWHIISARNHIQWMKQQKLSW